MKLLEALEGLFCRHRWEELPDEAAGRSRDTAILLNFKEVECTRCGRRARLTRQAYVQHLIKTGRFHG